jgi:hypothetical protein
MAGSLQMISGIRDRLCGADWWTTVSQLELGENKLGSDSNLPVDKIHQGGALGRDVDKITLAESAAPMSTPSHV